MKKPLLLAFFTIISAPSLWAQLIYFKDNIYSPYVLNDAKAIVRRQKILQQANDLNTLPIGKDSETSAPLEIGLWATSQFMVRTPQSDSGIRRLVKNYEQLAESTQRALLDVMYGLYPNEFVAAARSIMAQSTHPKNFAMSAAYVYRAQPTEQNKQRIKDLASSIQCNEAQQLMLKMLFNFIENDNKTFAIPAIDSLLAHQKAHGFKVIYSFQRKNRNYPGLAIIQTADGKLMTDSTGHLRSFVQLARSASNLPWFITNGSTPQGLYTITGTDVSKNVFIGPTPNLQMAMLGEVNPPQFTHYFPPVLNAPPERLYKAYFPESWQNWPGMMEAYNAGKIGRTEIIAHGTTISPEWFKGQPFYPISPTLGCLCGREIWNGKTGKIDYSDQLELVNAFIETIGTKGYIIVINLDDKNEPVSRAEVEKLVGISPRQ